MIEQLPKTIEQRLSNNSSNETIFNEAALLYEKALSEAGYDVKLKYNPNKKTKQKKNRKRNIVWFNLPYSKNVVTKVGHFILKLLDKHFPRQHKLHKIFNKNSKSQLQLYKIHKSIINSHNKQVSHQNRLCPNKQNCNCIKKELSPLNRNCQTENIVYEATITCNE